MDPNSQRHQLFMDKLETDPYEKGAFEQVVFKAMNKVYVYKQVMHLNSLIAIVINAFAVYIVLKYSPPQIKIYKRYLLNIMFWSFCLDIYLSFCYVPFFPVPVLAICSFGFLEQFNSYHSQLISFAILFVIVSCVGVSIMLAFVYRYLVLIEKSYHLHSLKSLILIGFSHVIYGSPVYLGVVYYILLNYEKIMSDMLNKYRSIYYFSYNKSCLYLTDAGSEIVAKFLLCLIIFEILVAEVFCVVVVYKILKYIKKYQSDILDQSFKRHKELTVSLIFQVAIPFIMAAIPFCVIIAIVLYNPDNQNISQSTGILLFEVASLHSTMNAISMLLLIKPYRQAIYKMFCSRIQPKIRKYRIEQQTREIS